MIREIKQIVENYINNRNMASLVIGTYDGKYIVTDKSKMKIPMSCVTGNLLSSLKKGDRVYLFQNDGGADFYLLEIIGLPAVLEERKP